MTPDFNMRTEDMPSEMGLLLAQYPRENWDAHPGFKEKTKHWLGAHQMFKRVARHLSLGTERFLDHDKSIETYANELSHYGSALVGNLHGHHGWEDYSYFPELRAADPRFDVGLDILEKDHHELDAVLEHFVEVARRTIKLAQLDEKQAFDEAAKVLGATQIIEKFLERHLRDEEELAVPIILHHRLRG